MLSKIPVCLKITLFFIFMSVIGRIIFFQVPQHYHINKPFIGGKERVLKRNSQAKDGLERQDL